MVPGGGLEPPRPCGQRILSPSRLPIPPSRPVRASMVPGPQSSGVRTIPTMKRRERRLFQLNDEIASLLEAERLAEEELIFHRHLDDDAQRDAAVSGNPLDRADAAETAADVARFEQHIINLRRDRAQLEARRERLLNRL